MFWKNFSHSNLIAAHRGHRAIRPENTLAAFEASMSHCDFIELDVGFSKDGVAIVIHDDTLNRTSNVQNLSDFIPPYNVTDYTYEQLQQLDISSWFIQSDPFGTIANGIVEKDALLSLPVQKILTLQEALKLCKRHNMPVNVEIKDMTDTPFDSTAANKTVSIIQELRMQSSILISSFNHSYLEQIKTIDPSISLAALQEKSHPSNIIEYLKGLDINCYNIDLDIADESIIKYLTSKGIIVNVYTVNNHATQQQLHEWGARAIFTDFLPF